MFCYAMRLVSLSLHRLTSMCHPLFFPLMFHILSPLFKNRKTLRIFLIFSLKFTQPKPHSILPRTLTKTTLPSLPKSITPRISYFPPENQEHSPKFHPKPRFRPTFISPSSLQIHSPDILQQPSSSSFIHNTQTDKSLVK